MLTFISTLSCLPLAICTLFWILNRILVAKPLPGIPYNRWTRWLPFGDLVTLGVHFLSRGSVFDWLSNQCLNHKSPIVQIMVPSFSMTSPVLLVADVYEVKDLILKRVHDIDRATMMRYGFDVLLPNATVGMHTTPSFKRQRHLWSCMLSPEFLDNVAVPAFEESIRRSIEVWKVKSQMSNGSSFAAYDDIRRVTLEGIWMVLSGRDLGLADASISHLQSGKRINTASVPSNSFPVFSQDLGVLITGLIWVVTGISPRFYRWVCNAIPRFRIAANRTKDMVAGLISETRIRLETGLPTTRCALTEVLRQHDNSVPDAAVIDETLELLIVGHESTASTMAWAVKYLADNQQVQERLHVALKLAFPGHSPSGQEISRANIPYLDAVMAEILRLSCTGPILFRETIRDCEIMGHQIPAHTPVFMITQSPSWSMITPSTFLDEERIDSKLEKALPSSKSPKVNNWSSEFEEFIPERWLDAEGNFDADAGLSLPFSAGKRGCFGKRIAMLELRLLIAMLVQSFHFPMLGRRESGYLSTDSLTRQPSCCFVRPVTREA